MAVWFDHIVPPDVCKYLIHIFFSIWVFFHSQIKGRQGKGKPITLYHFHPLQEHLGISRAITYSVHVSVDQTPTGNLLLPTALHQPLSYAPWAHLFLYFSGALSDFIMISFSSKCLNLLCHQKCDKHAFHLQVQRYCTDCHIEYQPERYTLETSGFSLIFLEKWSSIIVPSKDCFTTGNSKAILSTCEQWRK